MDWDLVVDVVSVGGGAGTLAGAIAAHDADAELFVAVAGDGPDPVRAADPAPPWYGAGLDDPRTVEYLAALVGDLEPVTEVPDTGVPVRAVAEPHAERGRTVEPFFGARLRDWAARCVSSPYGVLHTRVAGRGGVPARTAEGEAIEVLTLGRVRPPGDLWQLDLADWLAREVRERDIEVHPSARLNRLVFEADEVVGAVIDTPGRSWAVGARHGVTIAPPWAPARPLTRRDVPGGTDTVRIALVGQAASRFGRVEVLVPADR
ncbi:hypothetical protein [uncultured Mycolicibacterium sp.]|uniref:hypothetical protein n=1 Tax=uncultured Mycolicibacterium sp. TaxID=2320817 RepID=UPI0026381DE9|nr:hypothetical protein [uncultured Mycolicibacterium sp.]